MSAIRDILDADPNEAFSSPAPPPPPPPATATTDDKSRPPSQPLVAATPTNPAVARSAQDKQEKAIDAADGDGEASGAPTSARRNANGGVSSVYSGNKMRHLKKDDGVPLWRRDIQYDFLQIIFRDTTRCFTKFTSGTPGHTFADIYIDAMAKSSKCSKILKDKLLQDRDGAVAMAMVCLLVNVGRMNTTLNFFPEMRAQLRTYHSIPALQAKQDPLAYKQLQDAPRLKSILKGSCEDVPQPSTLEDVQKAQIPRTNPVNLVFLMSQYAPKISEAHFQPPRDFFDLIMRPSLSSASRACAFLWLMWWYLESDFTPEDALRNPFGAGQYAEGEDESTGKPFKVPTLESLTEEQAAAENADTEEEQAFGEAKRRERIAICQSEPTPAMTALKRARKEKEKALLPGSFQSDDDASEPTWSRSQHLYRNPPFNRETASDYTRSPSPSTARAMPSSVKINHLLNDDTMSEMSPPHPAASSAPTSTVKKGPGRGNWRRGRAKAEKAALEERSLPVPLLPNTGQLSFVNESPHPLHPTTPGSSFLQPGAVMSPQDSGALSFQQSQGHDHVPTPSYQAAKRHRGVTQHQSALLNHRRLQIDYTLDKRIRDLHVRARKVRKAEGSILRAWKRLRTMPPDYDSEDETTTTQSRKTKERSGAAGLPNDDDPAVPRSTHKHTANGKENTDNNPNGTISSPESVTGHIEHALAPSSTYSRRVTLLGGFTRLTTEPSDVGEQARLISHSLRRAGRRLERWDESERPGEGMIARRARRAAEASGIYPAESASLPAPSGGPPAQHSSQAQSQTQAPIHRGRSLPFANKVDARRRKSSARGSAGHLADSPAPPSYVPRTSKGEGSTKRKSAGGKGSVRGRRGGLSGSSATGFGGERRRERKKSSKALEAAAAAAASADAVAKKADLDEEMKIDGEADESGFGEREMRDVKGEVPVEDDDEEMGGV